MKDIKELAIQTCKPLLHVEKFSSDAAEKALVTPEDLLPAAGGSPAVFCPDTPLRKLFEDWVKRRAPIAEFTRNENGEYIVIGMHDEYLAFCAGSSVSIMESVAAPPEPAPQMPLGVSEGTATSACAAPSSEEVTKMVARLYGDLDGGPSSWLKQEAAAFIERLAARVDDLKQANDGLATAGILPEGCVVVPKEPTNEMIDAPRGFTQIIRGMTGCTFAQARAHCVNRGDNMLLWPEWARAEQGYVSEAAAALFIYQLMIAAGEVKP